MGILYWVHIRATVDASSVVLGLTTATGLAAQWEVETSEYPWYSTSSSSVATASGPSAFEIAFSRSAYLVSWPAMGDAGCGKGHEVNERPVTPAAKAAEDQATRPLRRRSMVFGAAPFGIHLAVGCREKPRTGIVAHRTKGRDARARIIATPDAFPLNKCHEPGLGSTTDRILLSSLLDARDALDLIAVTGSGEHVQEHGFDSPKGLERRNRPSNAGLEGFFLVKNGIVRPYEGKEYLDFYFQELWHLFPVVPQW
ncbi:hypothetical protein BDW71DRAFT_204883 [Aspergillus fruticulosus]